MTAPTSYPIGTPGTPWGAREFAAWRAQQRIQRRYADDVLPVIERLRAGHEVVGFDRHESHVTELTSEGLVAAASLEEAAAKLDTPRIFCCALGDFKCLCSK